MSSQNIPKDAHWSVAPIAAVDLEGNGRQPPDVVELGVILVDGGFPVALNSWLLRPDEPISFYATRIHGIKNKDVETAPRFDEIKVELEALLQGRYLAAHNAATDWSVLRRKLPTFEPLGVIDTLRLTRALYPGRSSYKLADLVDDFELRDFAKKFGETPHRAGYDAAAALSLLSYVAEHSSRGRLSFGELIDCGQIFPPTKNSKRTFL